jgi:hypothetical protein
MLMALQSDCLARIVLPALMYRRHSGQLTANGRRQSTAHAVDATTAEMHEELSDRLLGCGKAAYAALSGPGAGDESVTAARRLIDEVWRPSPTFDGKGRVSVRFNVSAFRRVSGRAYRSIRARAS